MLENVVQSITLQGGDNPTTPKEAYMLYKYRGYDIVLGGFEMWAVYSPEGERLGSFKTDTSAERFVDGLIAGTEN